uniref:Galectin n=1 Tax=Ailuropoda melanoleuca TaxID=9646 RepID=A0A7N5K2I6_AILME
MVVSNLNLKPGKCVDIKGHVPEDSKGFAINLGKDSSAIALHFNPRFDHHGDVNTIVCNSKDAVGWGQEQRETAFPFKRGQKTQICIHFDKEQLTIKLEDGQEMKFPNRLGLEVNMAEMLLSDHRCPAFS